MATVSVKTQVCDKCGSDQGVQRFVITFPNAGRRSVDLCGAHGKPLEEIQGLFKNAPRRGHRQSGQVVVSEATIQNAKKAARKKAAKKAPTK